MKDDEFEFVWFAFMCVNVDLKYVLYDVMGMCVLVEKCYGEFEEVNVNVDCLCELNYMMIECLYNVKKVAFEAEVLNVEFVVVRI